MILTEAQVQALEKKNRDDEARGEVETAHPGYLCSQDTFYVGTGAGARRDRSSPTARANRQAIEAAGATLL